MTSLILFRCPSCQARIRSPLQLVGHRRACPGCGNPITVPPLVPQDAGPLLTFDNVHRTGRARPPLGSVRA